MGILTISVISIISATKIEDMEVKTKKEFLTIIETPGYIHDKVTCLSLSEGLCQTWKTTGYAWYLKDCVWDGKCTCTAYLNDESLFRSMCWSKLRQDINEGYCVDCIYGDEKCIGNELYVCYGCQYVNQGKVTGKCGYEKQCDRYDPDVSNEKCEGYEYYICMPDDTWGKIGIMKGKCGVECITSNDCGSGEICEDYLCKPSFICTSGEVGCAGDNVIVCKGNQWEVKRTCEFGCMDGQCITEPPKPKPLIFQWFISLWKWIKSLFGG